jgi:hypothetical protein
MHKKLIIISVFSLALVALSGCGNKNTAPSGTSVNSQIPATGDNKSADSGSSVQAENLPVPTGKVDDTVDAIISGANSEGDQALSDDNEAKSATASDSEAVDEIGKEL